MARSSGHVQSISVLAKEAGAGRVGYKHELSNSVARTVQQKMQESVHLEDFGPVQSGVDNSVLINTAITEAGERELIFPNKTMLVTAPVNFYTRGSYRFLGAARGSLSPGTGVLLSTYTGVGAAFTFDGNGGYDQGLQFIGGVFKRDNNSGPAVKLIDVRDVEFINSAFYGGSANIHFDADTRGCWYNSFIGCKFIGFGGSNTDIGLLFDSTTGVTLPNENWFTGCSFRNHGTAIKLNDGDSNKFVQCAIEQSYYKGVEVNSPHNNFIGCRFEQNIIDTITGEIFDNNADKTRVHGCQFASSTALPSSRYLTGTKNVWSMIGCSGLPYKANHLSDDINIYDKAGNKVFSVEGAYMYANSIGALVRKDVNNEAFLQQRNGAGSSYLTLLKLNASDEVEFGQSVKTFSSWNGSHLIMGNYHLWVDVTGDLRIKNGAPVNDTDGAVVGSQS